MLSPHGPMARATVLRDLLARCPLPVVMLCRATADQADPDPDPAGWMSLALPSVDMVAKEVRPMLAQPCTTSPECSCQKSSVDPGLEALI